MLLLPPLVQFILIAVLGAGLGSFASALAYRIPRDISWTGRERSRCTSCNTTLTARDLVPILSWVMHRGKCRHCHAPVPRRYPLTELTAALMALSLWAAWGWGWPLLFLLAAVPFLLAHILIDAEHMILPDQINIILGVIFVLFSVGLALPLCFEIIHTNISIKPIMNADFSPLIAAFAAGPALAVGMLLTGWIMKIALKKEALGWGDIKFFVAAGWGIGFSYFPAFLMASGVIGVLTGIVWKWRGKGELFPFGPAIIIAFFLCLLARGAGLLGALGAY
jgi:prepilin signal peptidase PulO-like enzyme (type II secretory pathway)